MKKDILSILGIDEEKDYIINLFNYLFYHNNEFFNRFINLFLTTSTEKLKYKDSTMFIPKKILISKGIKSKYLDMVLYNKKLNQISLIHLNIKNSVEYINNDVKYSITNEIIEMLNLNPNAKVNYYYVGISKDFIYTNNNVFIPLSSIAPLFKIENNRTDLNIICESLYNRCIYLNQNFSYSELISSDFSNINQSNLWNDPAKIFTFIFKNHPLFKELFNIYNIEISSKYMENTFQNILTMNLFKNSWNSPKKVDNLDKEINECYNFSITIDFIDYINLLNANQKKIVLKLNYFLNSNLTYKELKKDPSYYYILNDKANYLYLLQNKYMLETNKNNYIFNKPSKKANWIIKKDIPINQLISMNSIIELILKEIYYLDKYIELFKFEIINYFENLANFINN